MHEREHDDLMLGPHEDVEKENARLRKEVRVLREEREVLKKAAIHCPAGECAAITERDLCRSKSVRFAFIHCPAGEA